MGTSYVSEVLCHVHVVVVVLVVVVVVVVVVAVVVVAAVIVVVMVVVVVVVVALALALALSLTRADNRRSATPVLCGYIPFVRQVPAGVCTRPCSQYWKPCHGGQLPPLL